MNCFRLALAIAMAVASLATAKAQSVGITPTEIRIGTISPFSGPASALGNTGKALIAFVKSINDRGGINGRKIDLIAYDDAYSPPKAMEQARRLVESDEIAFMFAQLGTPGNAATAGYLKAKGVPSGFIMSGAEKFADQDTYPNMTTGLPNFETEARIYARYALMAEPASKIAILYQNDDLGKAFVRAFTQIAGAEKIVAASYEVADPTVDSQVVNLKASGAKSVMLAVTPKFAAQAIRKMNDMGWKPLTFLDLIASSVSASLVPAGLENARGVVSASFFKDPNDSRWSDDAGMKDYRKFFDRYLAGSDFADLGYLNGYHEGLLLEQVLKQCGDDLSRENIARQLRNITNMQLPTALPGILINTNARNNQAWTQLQLQRFNGRVWEGFGEVLSGAAD